MSNIPGAESALNQTANMTGLLLTTAHIIMILFTPHISARFIGLDSDGGIHSGIMDL
jgi:hypothetical protein